MKSLKLKTLAALIEYHWWQVDRLRKTSRRETPKTSETVKTFINSKRNSWPFFMKYIWVCVTIREK